MNIIFYDRRRLIVNNNICSQNNRTKQNNKDNKIAKKNTLKQLLSPPVHRNRFVPLMDSNFIIADFETRGQAPCPGIQG